MIVNCQDIEKKYAKEFNKNMKSQRKIENLENKIRKIKHEQKVESEKLKEQNQELKKAYKKIQQRENYYLHDTRKKELKMEKLL
jgi:uncharacterized FlaG/YvyC family protein